MESTYGTRLVSTQRFRKKFGKSFSEFVYQIIFLSTPPIFLVLVGIRHWLLAATMFPGFVVSVLCLKIEIIKMTISAKLTHYNNKLLSA